jgi:hypothetical protein
MKTRITLWNRSTVYAVCIAVAFASTAIACQVPVFRYALERWNPDRYKLLVLTESDAGDEVRQLVKPLQSSTNTTSRVDVEFVDMAKVKDDRLKQLWASQRSGNHPLAVALYPSKATALRDQVAYVAPLTKESSQFLITSPARGEIATRLSSGDSAVWILLESGNKAKDDEAFQSLEQQLALDAPWLKVPTPEELEVKADVLERVKIRLQIKFSVIRVKRDDPKEQLLVQSLLGSEPDLREYDEPIAFPVFGRGLVLYGLVGKGIASDTIRAASSFIAGPCSCQVKEQNPGFDLLLDFDWDRAVGDTLISQPIPGTGAAPKLLAIPPGSKAKTDKN